MREHAYKFFDEHKREHEEVLDTCAQHMAQFLDDAGTSSRYPLENTLKRWVINHMTTSDEKMSLIIQGKSHQE